MKKALLSPLGGIDRIYDQVATYLDQSTELTFEALRELAKEEGLAPTSSQPVEYMKEVRQLLKTEMRKLYEPSKKHVERRYEFESKVRLG